MKQKVSSLNRLTRSTNLSQHDKTEDRKSLKLIKSELKKDKITNTNEIQKIISKYF
jgi:hypothetical protein